jgi:glyoxylase I family protein
MGARVHHSAICSADVEASLRFYRDGIGLEVLMDHEFEGDWATLFGATATTLRSIFLGDRRHPDAGIVELVDVGGAEPAGAGPSGPRTGFFLLSFFVDVEEVLGRLAALGHDRVRRIEQPGPRGPVAMATLMDPDGVRIELIDAGTRAGTGGAPGPAPAGPG